MRVRDLLPATLGRDLQVALLITAIGSSLGLASNALRPAGLPLIASEPYRVLVPCPEPGGPVDPLQPDAAELGQAGTYLIDARGEDAVEASPLRGAERIPYDYLDPTPARTLQALAETLTANRVERVVVAGDGEDPDSGEQLAREISAAGIRNVFFVAGGAPALLRARSGEDAP